MYREVAGVPVLLLRVALGVFVAIEYGSMPFHSQEYGT